MGIFTILETKQKPRNGFKDSEEMSLYLENRHLLTKFPVFSFLNAPELDDFAVIRANIIIHGFLNKKKIENVILTNSDIHDIYDSLEYYQEQNQKIFVPFFSRNINLLYSTSPTKLLSEPYSQLIENFQDSLIDPFDTYGIQLYDSTLTIIKRIKSYGKAVCFFNELNDTIYVVDEQGRLENKIVLFDKYLENINKENMEQRMINILDFYFNNDKKGFIHALKDNSFISSKMHSLLLR